MIGSGLTDDDRKAIGAALGKVDKRIVMNILKSIDEDKVPTDRQLEMLRSAAAMPDKPAPSEAAPEFKLEIVVVPEDQAGAAAFYEVNVKTIKRALKTGREAKDPCPYRAPERMAGWWERHHKNAVPDWITKAAAKSAKPPPPPETGAAETNAPAGLPSMDMSKFRPEDFNWNTSVMTARTILMAQHQLLVEALNANPPDDARRRKALADYEKAAELCRSLEKDSEKILSAQGFTLRRDDVRVAMIELHTGIIRRFKTELKEAVAQLDGVTMSAEEQAAWAEHVVDEACARLAESKFATVKIA